MIKVGNVSFGAVSVSKKVFSPVGLLPLFGLSAPVNGLPALMSSKFLSGFDGNIQHIIAGRHRTGGERSKGTGRGGGPVKIEKHMGAAVGQTGSQVPSCTVSCFTAGGIGKYNKEIPAFGKGKDGLYFTMHPEAKFARTFVILKGTDGCGH